MNNLFTIFILFLCAAGAYSAVTKDKNSEEKLSIIEPPTEAEKGVMERFMKFLSLEEIEDVKPPVKETVEVPSSGNLTSRGKRQSYGGYGGAPPQRGGYPQGPPPPRNQIMDGGMGAEFPDMYDFYPNDFLYDYYDWVCSDSSCQLCNILTSECCDPDVNVNCFLPDSCLNNPCLSGGTCIPTRTIDDNPDFICVCYPGFTGKYCQLTNEFFFPPPPPPMLPPPPQYNYQPQPQYLPQYQAPPPPQYQPQYQAPPPQYQPQYQAPPPPQVRAPAPYQAPPPTPALVRQAPSYGGSNQQLGPVPNNN